MIREIMKSRSRSRSPYSNSGRARAKSGLLASHNAVFASHSGRVVTSTVTGSIRRLAKKTWQRYGYWTLAAVPCLAIWIILTLLLALAAFWPSYTHPPNHYKVLTQRIVQSQVPGRGNINNEKVFLAAALYDKDGLLLGGDWGKAVVKLVELLGPDNVHLSVYENDPDPGAQKALATLATQLSCNTTLVSEHLSLEDIPRVTFPSGESYLKRIALLSEVRNRALRPLNNHPVQFDKLLYINDVMFNPIDAVQLLFSTNIDAHGKAQYGAACALDFNNAFKFYDRYATRDLEGHEMGVPIYPWFTSAGAAESRQDVLDQKDAVRVRSCWGGMTAFEAKWFQSPMVSNSTSTNKPETDTTAMAPLRFRHEKSPFWDASECCLVHADISHLRNGIGSTSDTGIYMNPYVRVAYDSKTLSWLPYTRRVERIFASIHDTISRLAGLPKFNSRRLESPGELIWEMAWETEESYHWERRLATPGGFCGRMKLSVINEAPKEGEKKFLNIPLHRSQKIHTKPNESLP